MSIDDFSGPLPRLIGAPAYGRPSAVATAPRPFDPDELPLEVYQTEEEREFAARLPARAYAPGGADVRLDEALDMEEAPGAQETLEPQDSSHLPKPPRLSKIAGRLLGRP